MATSPALTGCPVPGGPARSGPRQAPLDLFQALEGFQFELQDHPPMVRTPPQASCSSLVGNRLPVPAHFSLDYDILVGQDYSRASIWYAAYCSTMRRGFMATKERLTVNLQADDYRELQRIAQQHNVSMAWLGRRAIERFLEQSNSQLELPLSLPSRERLES